MCLCGRQLSQLLQIFYFLVIAIIIIKILMFRLHASLFRMRVTMLQFHSARLLRIEFFFVFWTCYFRSVQPWMTILETKKNNITNILLFLTHMFFFIQNMLKFAHNWITFWIEKNTKRFYNLADNLKKDDILLSKNLIYLFIQNVTQSVRNCDTFLDIYIYLYEFRQIPITGTSNNITSSDFQQLYK